MSTSASALRKVALWSAGDRSSGLCCSYSSSPQLSAHGHDVPSVLMRRQAGAAAEDQQQAQLLASLLDQLWGSGAAVAVVAAAGQRSHVSGALLRPGRLGVEVRFVGVDGV